MAKSKKSESMLTKSCNECLDHSGIGWKSWEAWKAALEIWRQTFENNCLLLTCIPLYNDDNNNIIC